MNLEEAIYIVINEAEVSALGDKSDEQIIDIDDVASITMIEDIYDIETLVNKICAING